MIHARECVVLVRHARPVINPESDPGTWAMDDSARGDVERLARAIAPLGCDIVVTSEEPKARSTGAIMGEMLGVPVRTDSGLGEQSAGTVPWIAEEGQFRARVFEHFRRPDEQVFGEETSSAAGRRLANAVDRWGAAYKCSVLVTHGRVMSAYMGIATATEPVNFWNNLRMPDAFVVDFDLRRWRRINKE